MKRYLGVVNNRIFGRIRTENMKQEMLTPEEIEQAFKGTNFGSAAPENIIKWSLLKIASGYLTGYTAQCILQELGLLSKAKRTALTKRGKSCLWDYFKAGYNHE